MSNFEQQVLPHPEIATLHENYRERAPRRIMNALVTVAQINDSLSHGIYAGTSGRYELEHDKLRTLSEIHSFSHDPHSNAMLTNLVETSTREVDRARYNEAIMLGKSEELLWQAS